MFLMSDAGRARIIAALSEPAVTPDRLAEVCLELLPNLDGASVTVIGDSLAHATVSTAGDRRGDLSKLQFTFGEGPYLDAHNQGRPVLVADISESEYRARWPAFAVACLDARIYAVFALPLRIGALRVGILNLHRRSPGPLAATELEDALGFAEAATLLVLNDNNPEATLKPQLRLDHRAVIHQATGIIMAQLGVAVEEAFLRLRAHTFVDGRSLEAVADEVVARRIRFDVEDEP